MPANPLKQSAGRIGGLTRSSRYTPDELTKHARRGFLARFLTDVDPDGLLPEAERERRAQAALKAHMARLAMASAQSRRKGGAA